MGLENLAKSGKALIAGLALAAVVAGCNYQDVECRNKSLSKDIGISVSCDDSVSHPGPDYSAEKKVIAKAADRLITLQNANGAWDWAVTDAIGPTATTYYNLEGVAAEGLLDAHKLTGQTKYLDAAKKAGDYVVATPISITQRQNAFTINFLHHLAQVSGDAQYSTKAGAIFNSIFHQDNYWAHNNGNFCTTSGCTPAELLSAYENFRSAPITSPDGIVAWDLKPFVEAAVLSNDSTTAQAIQQIINDYLSNVAYANTIPDYALGLASGVRAAKIMGVDPSVLVTALVAVQDGTNGSFGTVLDGKVQATSYALMALKDVNNSHKDAAETYLRNNFGYTGVNGAINGWKETDGNEYSEVTSESSQALFNYIQ